MVRLNLLSSEEMLSCTFGELDLKLYDDKLSRILEGVVEEVNRAYAALGKHYGFSPYVVVERWPDHPHDLENAEAEQNRGGLEMQEVAPCCTGVMFIADSRRCPTQALDLIRAMPVCHEVG